MLNGTDGVKLQSINASINQVSIVGVGNFSFFCFFVCESFYFYTIALNASTKYYEKKPTLKHINVKMHFTLAPLYKKNHIKTYTPYL